LVDIIISKEARQQWNIFSILVQTHIVSQHDQQKTYTSLDRLLL